MSDEDQVYTSAPQVWSERQKSTPIWRWTLLVLGLTVGGYLGGDYAVNAAEGQCVQIGADHRLCLSRAVQSAE